MSVSQLRVADPDEPPVRNPELARLVDLARRQPLAVVEVDVEQVRAAWSERRAKRRRWLSMAAAAALVALVGASAYRALQADRIDRDATADRMAAADVQISSADVETTRQATHPDESSSEFGDEQRPDEGTQPEPVPALADGVELEPRTPDAAYTVLGAWSVEVASGSYDVSTPVEALEILHVKLGDRTLVVEPGGVVRIVAGQPPSAVLVTGDAAWLEVDGSRTPLPAAASDAGAGRQQAAAALARKAERMMGAGDRRSAIAVYRALVRKYPRSASARAGLLDLARLLEGAGRRNEARCAYALYLERWPSNQLRPEIERALQRLGGQTQCRGLEPLK